MLRRKCILRPVIEGMTDGRKKVMGRRGRKHKLLLNELMGKKGFWKSKEDALDRCL